MDALLAVLTQPLAILLIAVGVFTGRVFFMARRLKSASRNLTLADLRALEEAKESLDKHRESLAEAQGVLQGNIGGARETLRTYKKDLSKAKENRLGEIKASMDEQKKDFEKLRTQPVFAEAKKLYKTAVPRKTHRAPTKEM